MISGLIFGIWLEAVSASASAKTATASATATATAATTTTDDVSVSSAREIISDAERKHRDAMRQLYAVNREVKKMANRRAQLSQKMMEHDARVRATAQDFQELEQLSEKHRTWLNQRLRQLYQGRGQESWQWFFSARTPAELERNQRFLVRMIDSDHQSLKRYVSQMRDLELRRSQLKEMVGHLIQLQKEVEAQESLLLSQQREKAKMVTYLASLKRNKLEDLRNMRRTGVADERLAFFEKRGALPAPIVGQVRREFGTIIDPQFRFRLMHKGFFYSAPTRSEVRVVSDGRIVLAREVRGYGKLILVDHGDNYYSVYSYVDQVLTAEGKQVKEGDVVALSGSQSPLFGPGLYFEIRHFTDAIDPRPWIKESLIKTARSD